MATSAHRAGADFKNIKQQGGWRHDGTVQVYIDEASQFEENAAGSLLRRIRAPNIGACNAKKRKRAQRIRGGAHP